jgi:hypothetical protein
MSAVTEPASEASKPELTLAPDALQTALAATSIEATSGEAPGLSDETDASGRLATRGDGLAVALYRVLEARATADMQHVLAAIVARGSSLRPEPSTPQTTTPPALTLSLALLWHAPR